MADRDHLLDDPPSGGGAGGAQPAARDYRRAVDAGRDGENTPPPPVGFTVPEEFVFKVVKTVPLALSTIFLCVIIVFSVFIVPILCNFQDEHGHIQNSCSMRPFTIVVIMHCVHWCGHLVCDLLLKAIHKKFRLRGYANFYMETKNLRRTPFYIVSVANALLLFVVATMDETVSNAKGSLDDLWRVDVLRGLMSVEGLGLIFTWYLYIKEVRKFNKARAYPDLLMDEARNDLLMEGRQVLHLSGSEKDVLLDKQGEQIRYLHSHRTNLNELLQRERQEKNAALAELENLRAGRA